MAPFTLAVMAIVVRGVAFSLRTEAPDHQARSAGLLGRAFGAGSVAAPLLFGASAAALAQVSSSTRGPATVSSLPWTGLFAGIVGLLAVALCAHLAATFVTSRLERARQAALADRFRRRGLQTGASLLALSLLSLLAAAWKAPALWHRLSTAALPLLVIGVLATVLSLYALARRRYLLARGATMLTAGAIVWGWLIAQSPRLIGARLTIHTAAATHAALTATRDRGRGRAHRRAPGLLPALPPLCPSLTGDNPMKTLPKTLEDRRLNAAAGALILWVALGPWIWGYASSPSAVASHVFFIFAFGPLTLLIAVSPSRRLRRSSPPASGSPRAPGYSATRTNHSAWLSELVTGALLTVVAAERSRHQRQRRSIPAPPPPPAHDQPYRAVETAGSRS